MASGRLHQGCCSPGPLMAGRPNTGRPFSEGVSACAPCVCTCVHACARRGTCVVHRAGCSCDKTKGGHPCSQECGPRATSLGPPRRCPSPPATEVAGQRLRSQAAVVSPQERCPAGGFQQLAEARSHPGPGRACCEWGPSRGGRILGTLSPPLPRAGLPSHPQMLG